MLRLLQVCNVGQIVGGTAACAWTVTRSLPLCEHYIVFLSSVSEETKQAFSGCRIGQWQDVTVSGVNSIHPDVVMLHNISAGRVKDRISTVSVQYLHSRISPAPADFTMYCSQWLAGLYGSESSKVCLQAVPRPKPQNGISETRSLRIHLVIGRICTPQSRKWPVETIDFYSRLSHRFPDVQWEFVGCPREMQSALGKACCDRALFWPASWTMRSRLRHWDAMLYHHPTLTESFGRTVAESMRAGCIPIVDDKGGFSEQIQEGCGFLCEKESDFVEAVEQLQATACRWRMSHACRAYAEDHFSLARFGQELLHHFREAVEHRQNLHRTVPLGSR